jgi:hypothetical protein
MKIVAANGFNPRGDIALREAIGTRPSSGDWKLRRKWK